MMKVSSPRDFEAPPASGRVRVQGGGMAATGLAILALLGYGVASQGSVVDGPLSRGGTQALAAWIGLLGLAVCGVGVQQLATGRRIRALQVLLGVLFVVTFAGAFLLLRNLG